MSPTRREILAGSLGVGGLAAFGVASRLMLSPRPLEQTAPVLDLAKALHDGLRESGREEAFVPYDHPLRQFHNRGVAGGGTKPFLLRRREQALLVDLIHASLSAEGRAHIPAQMFLSLLGVSYGSLLFCGSPHAPPYQVLFYSAHLNLRMGGQNVEGVAFGGPQVYGDETGNGKVGIPGNAYRDQLIAGQGLMAGLTKAEQARARRPRARVQTGIEVQGAGGSFDGIPLADATRASRERAREFVSLILGNYAEPDAAYAWECIERNGGIEAFHVADYDEDHQGGARFDGVPSQIFRLESPSAVFHYRATPHLHALLNVAMNGEQPLSVGETIGRNPVALGTQAVRALFEEVMREESGEALAYYPTVLVAGTLRAGTVRTGDLYSLESWESRIQTIEVERSDLAPATLADLEKQTTPIPGTERLRMVVPDGVARFRESYGIARVETLATGGSLRDATIAKLRRDGFRAT